MLDYLSHKYALSHKVAKDMVKAVIACTLSNIALMLPVSLLYSLVSDLTQGTLPGTRLWFYSAGIVVCFTLILLTTFNHYNTTFLVLKRRPNTEKVQAERNAHE